jgi:hypothetical protein
METKQQFLAYIRSALDNILDNRSQDALRQTMDGGEFHFSLGMWLRNNWGLWKGGNELTDYFNSIGIYHADDMSSIILFCYVKLLRGDDFDFEKEIKKYKDYWIEHGIDIKKESIRQYKSLWERFKAWIRGYK